MGINLYVVSVIAEDVPTATRFYRDVLGLDGISHSTSDRPHFDLGGSYLTIVHGQRAIPAVSEIHFPVVAFSVPDLEEAIKNLYKNNVDLPWGVEENAATRWVKFYDPGGNLVELVEIKKKGTKSGI